MEFLNDGVERAVVDFEVDMSVEERVVLFEYARDEMDEDVFEEIMINWAIVDILEKKVNELTTEDK